jgi:hypothetical protein
MRLRLRLFVFVLFLVAGVLIANAPADLHDWAKKMNGRLQDGVEGWLQKAAAPNIDDPVALFDARILGAEPEAEGRISSLKLTHIAFAVKESHAEEILGEAKKDDECGADLITLRSGRKPKIDAVMEFAYLDERRVVDIAEGQSRIALPFSHAELDSAWPSAENGSNASAMPVLQAVLRVRGTFFYTKEVIENRYSCQAFCSGGDCRTGCGCATDRKATAVTFEKNALDYANYTVETGEPFVFPFVPVLREQTMPVEKYTVVVLSNRQLSEYDMAVGAARMGAILHNYSIAKNGLDFWKLEVGDANQSLVRLERRHIEPAGLAENRNYSHAYSLEFTDGTGVAGKKPASILLYDDFGDEWNVSLDFKARELQIPPSGDGILEGFALLEYPGSDEKRPTNEARMRIGWETRANFEGFWLLAAIAGVGIAGALLSMGREF